MPAHQRVRAWVAHNYQKPAIDQEWLADCSEWLSSELSLDPVRDFDQFTQHVEAQLLQSNLADSTVPGSGIDPLLVPSNPPNARQRPPIARRPGRQAPRQKKTTGATPLLVEVKNITEIAHSAFSLLNMHQAHLDRADLGLAQEEIAEQHRDQDEGPVPRFPRGMLKFELSDGLTTFSAIEFRSLPQLELGTTPLGYKMFLKSTPIRGGVAFLEPSNVILKGYKTEDHDVNREQIFLSSLRKRLGRPDPPEIPVAAQPQVNLPEPSQPACQYQPPPAAQPPLPRADIDDMYLDDVHPDVLREMFMDDDLDMRTRPGIRALPPAGPPPTSKENLAVSPNSGQILHVNAAVASSSRETSSATSVKTSSYFTAHSSQLKSIPDIGLSPRSGPPPDPEPDFDITWDTDNAEPSKPPPKKIGTASTTPIAMQRAPQAKQISSPDPYDDLSFDMNVDEEFLEQVGIIEQGALATGTNIEGKGKGRDKTTQRRPSTARAKKAQAGSAVGTRLIAKCSVSASGAEPSMRMQSSAKSAAGGSSFNSLIESSILQSTQLSDRRLPRDPSLIVILSSENEAPTKPLDFARRNANKKRKKDLDLDEVVGSDVIDISD